MKETLVSESILPLRETFDFSQSSPGEPAIPRKFKWRKETVEIDEVVRKWKTASPCTHGSGEQYVRRHWFEIATKDHGRMQIYFDRTAATPRKRKNGWRLYAAIDDK